MIGDWEIDTIVGANQKGAITTVVERVTSLVRISIPTSKKALDYEHYFCHPYSSGERGLNEYTNRLIRQYIPKGTSFENITLEYIKMIEDKLNNRPRKALNWKTPNEVFKVLK